MFKLTIPTNYAFHIRSDEVEPRTIIVSPVGDEKGSLEYYMCVRRNLETNVNEFVDLETGELVGLSHDHLVAKVDAELIIGPQNTNH